MRKIFFLSDNFPVSFIKSILHKYELSVLTIEDIKKNKLFNKNVIIFESEKIRNELDNSFFSSNNVVVFSSSKNTLISENNNLKTKFFNKPIKLEKFLDNINNYLLSSSIKFKDIEISGELLTNVNNKKSQKITSLEKKILLELAEKKKLKRDYFLENILEVKKDTETKTIESHLTRIRKKLSNIKSETQVISKEDFFYLKI
tara:strand:- start:3964 stop:4569 length:606 start_codon:yes stop_codon:yes gene_type:complete